MVKFVCGNCGEEKEVWKCCGNEPMRYEGSYLVCRFCGAIRYFPWHCGLMMKIRNDGK